VGEDLDLIREDATALRNAFSSGYRVRPTPGNFDKASREIRIKVDFVKASALGIQAGVLGTAVQGLVDGVTIGDYRMDGDNIDLLLTRDPDLPLDSDTLEMVPIAYYDRDGKPGIVPLSHLADVTQAQSPQQILRIDYQRAVMLSLSAPPGVPLEQMAGDVQATIDRMRQEDRLSAEGSVTLSGTADKLTQVRGALLGQWHGWNGESFYSILTSRMFLALLVTFLLMAALFESFLYPMVIMFSVPLATIGGFIGLALVRASDSTQQLDTLTMLGFVILVGIVVNNAILIVHQALNFMRGVGEGGGDRTGVIPAREAIRESVRSRIRPIFMTTATSVCGMLPLVLMPGSGSELYKGLGSVVVGGLIVSTLFTLIVVPLLFSLVLDAVGFYFQLRGKASPGSTRTF
jgi:multidrug efflux pump subunit AcrB